MTPAIGALREALFWMNSSREQLAATELALERMWALVAQSVRSDGVDCRDDIDLMMNEVHRVRARLDYWTGIVDRMTVASALGA